MFQLGFILHFLLVPESFGMSLTNPPLLEESMDPALMAVHAAMEAAFTVNVAERPMARDIGDYLADAMAMI